VSFDANRLPAAAGIGLRSPHVAQVRRDRPPIGWLEVHSENYFVDGGPALAALDAIRADYPISLHGVGLSLGSADALDAGHLAKLKRLAARVEPAFISEHLCWGRIDGRHLNDLLPLPFTDEALAVCCNRIDAVQAALGRALLVENVSAYLRFTSDAMAEWDFVAAVARRTGEIAGVLHRIGARIWLIGQGVAEAPTEPGARTLCEPWLAGPREKLWRLIVPWKPLPLDTPEIFTTWPGSASVAVITPSTSILSSA